MLRQIYFRSLASQAIGGEHRHMSRVLKAFPRLRLRVKYLDTLNSPGASSSTERIYDSKSLGDAINHWMYHRVVLIDNYTTSYGRRWSSLTS